MAMVAEMAEGAHVCCADGRQSNTFPDIQLSDADGDTMLQ